MKKFYLDKQESRKLLEQYDFLIAMKECYDNVYRLFLHNAIPNHYNICYGFIKVQDNLYAKHCFLQDKNTDKIVDATILKASRKPEDVDYIIMKSFGKEKYRDLLLEDGFTDLDTTLRMETFEFMQKAMEEEQIVCCG